ncbi:uncharacterized protein LOC110178246 [Drosophila serrata]|uniref:uncharacterized protein LOC110178246 n=1 Tax=Drosophila serrata TaxID=7274 RepID=UPI000A1D298F|nr:uncharacterized protein LOC110178246 [Drosophila serrata]
MEFLINDGNIFNKDSDHSLLGISNHSATSGIGPGNALPITAIASITNLLDQCNKPACDEDVDMQCIVDLVTATICEAKAIIESDPRGLFCYKYPKMTLSDLNMGSSNIDVIMANDNQSYSSGKTTFVYGMPQESVSSGIARRDLTIENFDYSDAIADIRDFISRWALSPDTKCVVTSNPLRHEVPVKGTIFFVDAHFSQPTPRCPNPLAVAKVRFFVTVSKLMMRSYPIMITYRFEGYNTLYYVLGERSLNLFHFQRFYIDTILHTKLTFFAAIAECRHGTVENPKDNVRPKKKTKSPVRK